MNTAVMNNNALKAYTYVISEYNEWNSITIFRYLARLLMVTTFKQFIMGDTGSEKYFKYDQYLCRTIPNFHSEIKRKSIKCIWIPSPYCMVKELFTLIIYSDFNPRPESLTKETQEIIAKCLMIKAEQCNFISLIYFSISSRNRK